MRNRTKAAITFALILGLLLLVAAACGGSAVSLRTPTPPPETTTPTPTPSPAPSAAAGLKPADSDSPAAGICAPPPPGDSVTFTIRPDVPDPRCSKILPTQRVRLVNDTGEPVRIQLAQFDVTLAPGADETFDAAVGTYLAAGVHVLRTSRYDGSGPTLWLIGD